jgi:hypothetical protein
MSGSQLFIQGNLLLLFISVSGFLLLFLFWNIILSLKIRGIRKRTRELFSGDKVPDLENLLIEQAKSIKILDKDIQELFDISNQINALASKGLHKVGIIRFNPFKDVGGDQSFAIALLNGKGNGLTLSSLYSREGTRIYAKSIIAGESEKHPLTEEEKQAIKMALEKENNK